MFCPAVTLSLATITAIVATALLAFAFSTDNWVHIEVKRSNIKAYAAKHGAALWESMNSKYYFYTRTEGLFRSCFPEEWPALIGNYLSPEETHCIDIEYILHEVHNQTKDSSEEEGVMTRLHTGRAVITLFIAAFFSMIVAFSTVTAGWRSPEHIAATAILILIACILSAGAIMLWHGVEYYERERVAGKEFYQQWNDVLRDSTYQRYDWSFFLAWTGVGLLLVSAVLFSGAICLLGVKQQEETVNLQYLVPLNAGPRYDGL